MRQIGLGARCKLVVDFDRRHMPSLTDDVGENRAVIPGAASDVDDALASLQLEIVKPQGEPTRQTIVQQSLGQDAHQNVIVDVTWMRVCRQAITEVVSPPVQASFARCQHLPRSRTEVAFTGNFYECPNQQLGTEMRLAPKLSCITPTRTSEFARSMMNFSALSLHEIYAVTRRINQVG